MRAFYRTLRILSAITLFFFCWTFLPLYAAVAYAATPPGQGTGKQTIVSNRPLTTSERFEKSLDAIRENVSKAGEKADKGEDNAKELMTIKAKRAEIESADIEFKKEFAATEKKLKDANLAKEILDRHAKFVKNYEDNLKELKTNLTGIEQGAGSKGFKESLNKAKDHLEKVKPLTKHIPLDPNNLPHRTVKAKKRPPRLKKEEFEKDFPTQKKQKTKFTAEVAEKRLASWFETHERIAKQKPILVASNGSIAGLLSSNNQLSLSSGAIPQLALPAPHGLSTSAFEPLMLAQAVQDIPTAADLSETPEVQFTFEIRAKAQELGSNSIKIYGSSGFSVGHF